MLGLVMRELLITHSAVSTKPLPTGTQHRTGNIEKAASVASRALELSAEVTSSRGTERIKTVRGLLVPYHGNAAVEEFEERAREALEA
jgi:hypothetical protein